MPRERRPRVLYGRRRIAARVRGLAREIDRAYRGRPLTLCAVLAGGVVFASDLARALRNDRIEIAFARASSYGDGAASSGRVKLDLFDEEGIAGRDVLVVEDIVETGRTLRAIEDALLVRGARTVRSVVLLEKPGKRAVQVEPDWVGFRMRDDSFVAGYGLDAGRRFRNLPDIVVPG